MHIAYDNGGATADRFTVFPYADHPDPEVRGMYLALSDDPTSPHGFSQWGELRPGQRPEDCGHVGKPVPFISLPANVRRHVAARVRE